MAKKKDKPVVVKKPIVKAKPKVVKKSVKRVVKSKPAVKNYDQDFEYVCLEIERGMALRKVCPTFMSVDKFHSLCIERSDLNERYARACEIRRESMFEEILEISNESNPDICLVDGKLVIDGEAIQRSKLKIEARKWMLSKMDPKKYGDRLEVDSTSKIEVTQKPDFTKLSKEELKSLIELQRKIKPLNK